MNLRALGRSATYLLVLDIFVIVKIVKILSGLISITRDIVEANLGGISIFHTRNDEEKRL